MLSHDPLNGGYIATKENRGVIEDFTHCHQNVPWMEGCIARS
jgi:hypothetical protein